MTIIPKILIIDDELGIREGCKRALAPQGFAVDTAENGDDGLRQVQVGGYDLVLLDVMMPGTSGIDLIATIHQHDPEIVCIIITGYATIELAVNAIKQGAYDFLTKPFTPDDLLLAVNQGLERRRLSLEAKRLQTIEEDARRLAEEKIKLEEIDLAKRRFILLVTHELQSPMAAIQNYLQLLHEGYIEPEQQREIIEKCMARGEEQMALISDLLELGHLREVKKDSITLIQLEDVLRSVLDEFESQAIHKGLHLSATIGQAIPPVRGAAKQLKSVWTNLIGNAIKYTPEGGTVQVNLQCEKDRVIGQVSDTGIGIPDNARAKLFSEFFRAENAKALKLRGTGLGLTIVKQIIESAGGRITVESQPGQGSTFTFTLPAHPPLDTLTKQASDT